MDNIMKELKKIIILSGGFSSERAISLQSSKAVAKTFAKNNYAVYLIDIASPDEFFLVNKEKQEFPNFDKKYNSFSADVVLKLVDNLNKLNADTIFIGLHGGEGENGKIQALLDLCNFSYTGSNHKASAIGMDKIFCKVLANFNKIPTADFKVFTAKELEELSSLNYLEKIISKFGYPVVFKANEQGSSVGVYIFESFQDFESNFLEIKNLGDDFILEKYIKGHEISIPVIEGSAYPIVEIKPHEGFYDYEHKYKKGVTDHICPAPLSECVANKIRNYAIKIYNLIGCKDYARVDFIISEENIPYFLEINTLPGMTELSLTPESAKEAGVDFISLLETIIN